LAALQLGHSVFVSKQSLPHGDLYYYCYYYLNNWLRISIRSCTNYSFNISGTETVT